MFGSGIDKITTASNKTVYLNKGSLDKWKVEARKMVTDCNVSVDDTTVFINSILSAIKQKNLNNVSPFYKKGIEEEEIKKQNLIDGFKKLNIPKEGLSGSYKTESCEHKFEIKKTTDEILDIKIFIPPSDFGHLARNITKSKTGDIEWQIQIDFEKNEFYQNTHFEHMLLNYILKSINL